MWRKERTGVGRWAFTRKMAPGDGLKGAQRRSQRAKKARDWGARDMGEEYRRANVQRRYFNQFGGAQQERSIITHVL